MDFYSTKPVEEIDLKRFKKALINKKIEVSPHALDQISRGQRKVFKERELIYLIERENPRKIYLQKNGRYSAYYRKSDGFRKLILDINHKRTIIVTFIDLLELPRIRLENE